MPHKQFSERLNKELDVIGVPPLNRERIAAFAQLIDVTKFQAEELLNGNRLPDSTLLTSLATELDVNGEWLIGKSDIRQRKDRAN